MTSESLELIVPSYTVLIVTAQLFGALCSMVRMLCGTPPVTLAVRKTMGRRMLVGQVFLLAFMVSTWRVEAWTLSDVGAPEVPPWVAFVAGAMLYFPLVLLIRQLYTLAGHERWYSNASFESLRDIYPRSKRQKCMFAIGMMLNPITEEWLYRGMLVTWAYALTDSVGGLVVAVMVSAIVHSYQKPIALPFHLLFATAACCVVLSPLGYIGAVGLHMAGDLYPLANMKTAFHRWNRARARGGRRIDSRSAEPRAGVAQ